MSVKCVSEISTPDGTTAHQRSHSSAGIRQSPTKGRQIKGTAIHTTGSNRDVAEGPLTANNRGLTPNRQSSRMLNNPDCSDTLKSLRSCGRLPPQSVDNGLTAALSTGLRSALHRYSDTTIWIGCIGQDRLRVGLIGTAPHLWRTVWTYARL
jgi:hypothetical protein